MTTKPHRREEPDLLCRLINFVLLQWIGLRLSRRMRFHPPGAFDRNEPCELVQTGWRIERWIWPLSGWWFGYRWIARRPDLL